MNEPQSPSRNERQSWTAPLTRHEIEMVRQYGVHVVPYERRPEVVIALCDTALAAIGSENVRCKECGLHHGPHPLRDATPPSHSQEKK